MATNTTSPAASSSRGVMFISLLAIILLSIALAVGLPGNSFVVWSILKRMHKRSVTALLVLNLALADLAVLLTAPFFLHFLAHGTWSFKLAGCRLCHYICGVSMYASVLFITVMSLDRSLAVARPFMSQKLRTKEIVRPLLAAIWVVSFLLATPVLAYRTVSLGLNNRSLVCFPKYPNERHRAFHLLFEAFTGFLLPFLVVRGGLVSSLSCFHPPLSQKLSLRPLEAKGPGCRIGDGGRKKRVDSQQFAGGSRYVVSEEERGYCEWWIELARK
uniref:Leukotriene B4 receptor n=1 Tax=Spermophilus dauricus TaxID=99837 RepID=A0A8C9QHG3_SPEDA